MTATWTQLLWLACGLTGAVTWACFLALALWLFVEHVAERREQARADAHTPDLDAWAAAIRPDPERTDRP